MQSLINDSRVKVIVKTYEVAVLRYSVFLKRKIEQKVIFRRGKKTFLKSDQTTDIKILKGKVSGHSFNLKLYQCVAVAPCSLLSGLVPPVKVTRKD